MQCSNLGVFTRIYKRKYTVIPLLLKILSSKSQYFYIIIFFNYENSSLEISEQFGSMLELLHKKS
jgi:hypothetical protein